MSPLPFAFQSLALTATGLVTTSSLWAQDAPRIEFLGTASIPGDARDHSGYAAILENEKPGNPLGGFSALDFSGSHDRYAALSDRGPDDGAVGYPCRVQILEIRVQPAAAVRVSAEVVQTIFFTDQEGRRFTGSSAALDATRTTSHRFDPEGFRFGTEGSMYVSDEYGPDLIEFASDGREKRRISLPEHLKIQSPSADRKGEILNNVKGRAANRGMECLALSTDGKYLVGLMQSSLLQDADKTADGLALGINCRLLRIELETGRTQEYVYQLDSQDNGNSEILAWGPDQFLVLERDSLPGSKAGHRKLILIDLADASEISAVPNLPPTGLPEGIRPVSKTIFLDFLDAQWGLSGETMPEKIEGLTFGPTLEDGRRTLLVGTDNDFESANASQIWVFAVSQ